METDKPEKELRKIYTVSELTSEIRSRLESAYPFIWVTGEISNFSCAASGHMYFSLKDAHAQIACVLFKAQARHLKFLPSSGLRVIGFGRISLYPPRGAYQLILEYLEPMGTGSLQLAFEQLKIRLEAEGLFDAARKRPLPFLPLRISLVTSPVGAVLHDMLKVLRRRFPNLQIEVAPVRVQGEGAAEEIARAIQTISAQEKSHLILLARGGGSLEDLAAFNSETVARAVFSAAMPVITGIGHETDFTIADFVADLRTSTPTAAAESAVPEKARLKALLQGLEQDLIRAFQARLDELHQKNTAFAQRLLHPRRHLALCRIRLDETMETLQRRFQHATAWKQRQLLWASKGLSPMTLRRRVQRERSLLRASHRHLYMHTLSRIQTRRAQLEGLTHRLRDLGPLSVLSRGYAVTRKLPEQRILCDTTGLLPGDEVEIQLASGRLRCRIEDIQHGEKNL